MFFDMVQCLNGDTGVNSTDHVGSDSREFGFDDFDVVMGMPFFESFRAEKLTVKRGEKPGFQLLWVTELVAFSGPIVKSLSA